MSVAGARSLRRAAMAAAAVLLVSCSSGDGCGNAKCAGGITFAVGELAGALAPGSSEPLHICFDGSCQDVTVSRAEVGGSVFLAFEGVGDDIDHEITVTGVGALTGEYRGRLDSFEQKPNGSSCDGSCALATVKIGADGTLTPGVPLAAGTTTTTAQG